MRWICLLPAVALAFTVSGALAQEASTTAPRQSRRLQLLEEFDRPREPSAASSLGLTGEPLDLWISRRETASTVLLTLGAVFLAGGAVVFGVEFAHVQSSRGWHGTEDFSNSVGLFTGAILLAVSGIIGLISGGVLRIQVEDQREALRLTTRMGPDGPTWALVF